MRKFQHKPEADTDSQRRGSSSDELLNSPGGILALQRLIGNQATMRHLGLLNRKEAIDANNFSLSISRTEQMNIQRSWLYEVENTLDDRRINSIAELNQYLPNLGDLLYEPEGEGLFKDNFVVITDKGNDRYDLILNGEKYVNANVAAVFMLLSDIVNQQNLIERKKRLVKLIYLVRELIQGLAPQNYVITGSLAMQMWQLAVDPDSPLQRKIGDVDIMVPETTTATRIGEKIIIEREKAPGNLYDLLVTPKVNAFPNKFYGKQMTEEKYKGEEVDIKLGGDTRWGRMDPMQMPVQAGPDQFPISVQSPQALIEGLQRKLEAVKGKPEEEGVSRDLEKMQEIAERYNAFLEA